MKKVLLITTPYRSKRYEKIIKMMPPTLPFLGIAYIAALLRREGISVKVLDAWGGALRFEDIKREIEEYRPDIIGITSTAVAFGIGIELAKLIKASFGGIPVVFGGPYVSAIPRKVLEEIPWIDIVVIGEGEYTMLELAQRRALESIKGIAYRAAGGEIKINEPRPPIEDLDTLPFPDRDFYDIANYRRPFYEFHGKPFAPILTSRGCPFLCRFCASHIVSGRRVRLRSIKNIVEEIDLLVDKYKVKFISIADDAPVFTMDMGRLQEFCSAIKGKGFFWGAKARADTINSDNLAMMKGSGCRVIEIGCESGNPDILKQWKKGVSVEQIKEAFRLLNKFKISSVAMFMLGAPEETKETILRTIDFSKELEATYVIARILYPYPGTDAYDYLQEHKMIRSCDWEDVRNPKAGDAILTHPNLTTSELLLPKITFPELRKMQRRLHVEFYSNPKYISATLLKLKDWQVFKAYFKMLAGVLRFWCRWGLQ